MVDSEQLVNFDFRSHNRPALDAEQQQQQHQQKRPRRGAAALAMQQMLVNVSAEDSNHVTETIRGIQASADVPMVSLVEEDSSISEVASSSSHQKTIKRLEEEVNRLKRNAQQDKTTIEQLKTVAERAVEAARKRPAAAVENASGDLVVDLSCALVQKHVAVLELEERLSKTEAKLAARHDSVVPECRICFKHNATVLLHPPRGSGEAAEHWFCYDCVQRHAVVNRLGRAGTKMRCPSCNETVETLPPVNIATLAASSLETWQLSDSDVSQRAFADFGSQERVKGLREFMSALSVPTSTALLEQRLTSRQALSVVNAALDKCVMALND